MKGRGEARRWTALTWKLCLELLASGRARAKQSPLEELFLWSVHRANRRLEEKERTEQRGSKRARKAGVQLCPTRSSTAHCKPLERASAEQSLGQVGGRRSRFLATLINLLGIAPLKEFDWTAPGGKPRPFKNAGLLLFRILPNFLGGIRLQGSAELSSFLLSYVATPPHWSDPRVPPHLSFSIPIYG